MRADSGEARNSGQFPHHLAPTLAHGLFYDVPADRDCSLTGNFPLIHGHIWYLPHGILKDIWAAGKMYAFQVQLAQCEIISVLIAPLVDVHLQLSFSWRVSQRVTRRSSSDKSSLKSRSMEARDALIASRRPWILTPIHPITIVSSPIIAPTSWSKTLINSNSITSSVQVSKLQ